MSSKGKRHSIDQTVESLLPESIRKNCLMKFRESIIRANEGGSSKWGVYHGNNHIRLLVGSLIIFTIERKGIWLALDNELLDGSTEKLLDNSPDWLWAGESEYPIYKAIPSRNGYYIPSKGESKIWPIVRELHYELIGKAVSKYSQLRSDSQAHHEPELLQYLSRELGQSVPEPDYTAIPEVSVEQNKVWFFQSNPNRYRLLCALSDPEMQTMYWQVNQHRKEIRQGDTALIWMSGDNAGIYAVAEVISGPVLAYDADEYWIDENDKNAKKLRVKIRITSSLVNRPILRSELSNNDQLRNLSILRFAQGTNFAVTNSEWEILRQEYPALAQRPSDLAAKQVRPLEKYEHYTREEVHDIFSPHTEFAPNSGTWGILGIIQIPERPNDFVFFVTYGRKQGEHTFEEAITQDGILTWQSQTRQKFSSPMIEHLTNHNHLENSIYLFLRTSRNLPYTYLGRLAYVEHDSEREQPVYFKWQILDWDLTAEKAQEMGLEFEVSETIIDETKAEKISYQLTETPPPVARARTGLKTVRFRGRHVSYEESGRRNKALGNAGELAVLEREEQILIDRDRVDLTSNIVHVSMIEGDGAGYDIKSYTPDGEVKYIEVKTTKGGPNSPFYISSLEIAFSEEHPENYYLYRLYDFDPSTGRGNFFLWKGVITDYCQVQPVTYRASPI